MAVLSDVKRCEAKARDKHGWEVRHLSPRWLGEM